MFGVWFGRNKPNFNVIFDLLQSQLESINERGLNLSISNKRFNLNIYGLLCDSPAKALVLRMNQLVF